MGHERIGKVSYGGYTREVAYDKDSGHVDRQFGNDKTMPSSTPTSREVGYANSRDEALDIARDDLKDTFKK